MNDKKFFKELSDLIDEVMSSQKDEDYEINAPQYEKYLRVAEIFLKAANEMGGKTKKFELVPRFVNGDAEIMLPYFTASGNRLKEIVEALETFLDVTVDVMVEDKLFISSKVPNVFIKKTKLIMNL